jgi:hypothetical protein
MPEQTSRSETIVADDDVLSVRLEFDTARFLRRELEDGRSHNNVAELVSSILDERRKDAWRRALTFLLRAGWTGAEIFAAADVARRYPPTSREAEREIAELWTHLSLRRWRRRSAQLRQSPVVADALFTLAHEFNSADDARECKAACLAVYEGTNAWARLWSRLSGRKLDAWAKIQLLDADGTWRNFVAVRRKL